MGRKRGPQIGSPPSGKPRKQAKFRATGRLDRTQEVAGSSPASSTPKFPATARFLESFASVERVVRRRFLARSLARSPRERSARVRGPPLFHAVFRIELGSVGGT